MTVDIEKAFQLYQSFFLDVCVNKNWIWQPFWKIDTNLNEKPRIVCYQWW